MVFSSAHTRLTRTSSDLRMLSAILLPPSPVLNADDLLISSTSGEIPILLEATTHGCDSPLPTFGEPLGLRDVDKDKLDITVENVARDLTRSDESLLENRMCGESDSDDVCITPEFPNERRAVSAKLKNAIHPVYEDIAGIEAERSSILGDCSTPIVKQGKLQGLRDPQAACPCTMEFSTTNVVPREDLDGDQLLTIATFHTYSMLPTPTFAPPSPSSSADVISPSSSPVGRQRHRRPLERARAVRFPGRPRSPRLQVNEVEPNLVRNAPPSPTKQASFPRWQLTDAASPVSTHSCTTDTRLSDAVLPFMKHVALPEELSWIKHMIIELWIDQEGFRAVRSCMQLMGYSPRTRSLHPYEPAEDVRSGITAGLAEFMPTKRETFTFHYATLDSPPTLRMVSVAGDESRDYISRQATLSVKANGVYTVLGTEGFVAPILNDDAHGSKLRWKFDYLVSDRKVDGTGKTLPGEKTLTPLTFSCSPYLFHPLQGKKAGLMHIMKKNLVPKLGSQKLEPPTYALSHSVPPHASRHLSTGRDPATHARSRSDASSPKSGYYPLTRSPLDTGCRGGTMLGTNHAPRARRRRASSAGENSFICLKNKPEHGGIVTLKAGMLVPGTSLF
ncbi:hypothetical protein JVT61DRAFT_5305 [Boletus reticuloceps]|uniref:Uncharacterized protein n=1 Tax=Boletus reticuloceps TaxID=495285 RepID=A0A8I3AEZ6_9AGAM|nr:hypothetical protein JVT61DRAFT_5305 [Boletus reticuloceps]